MKRDDLVKYVNQHYKGNRMVLAAAGGKHPYKGYKTHAERGLHHLVVKSLATHCFRVESHQVCLIRCARKLSSKLMEGARPILNYCMEGRSSTSKLWNVII